MHHERRREHCGETTRLPVTHLYWSDEYLCALCGGVVGEREGLMGIEQLGERYGYDDDVCVECKEPYIVAGRELNGLYRGRHEDAAWGELFGDGAPGDKWEEVAHGVEARIRHERTAIAIK